MRRKSLFKGLIKQEWTRNCKIRRFNAISLKTMTINQARKVLGRPQTCIHLLICWCLPAVSRQVGKMIMIKMTKTYYLRERMKQRGLLTRASTVWAIQRFKRCSRGKLISPMRLQTLSEIASIQRISLKFIHDFGKRSQHAVIDRNLLLITSLK